MSPTEGHQDGCVYIGTSGFNPPGWDRSFYPAGTKQRDRLLHYAMHIPTVEIAATRHLMPRRDVFEKWAGTTPSDFIFSFSVLKGWHPGYVFAHGLDQVEIFYRRASLMGEKFGPIAITIPDGTPYVKGDAQRYFSSLPAHNYAIDLQSVAWYNNEVFREMAARDMTFVRDRIDDSDGIGSWDYYRAPISEAHDSGCSCGCGKLHKAAALLVTGALKDAAVKKKKTYFYAKVGDEGLTPNLILRLLKVFGPRNRVNFVDITDVKKKVLGPSDPVRGPNTGGSPVKYNNEQDRVDVMKKDPYTDEGKQDLRNTYPLREWDGKTDPYSDCVDKGY